MFARPRLAAVVLAAVFASFLMPFSASAQGCAMCGTVGKGAEDPLVKGMFRSIVMMVSMPFSVVAGVGGWIAYRVRRGEPGLPPEGPDDDSHEEERLT